MRYLFLIAGLFWVLGCGATTTINTAPLTADEKRQMDEEQKKIEDEERGTPVKAKGKKR